MYIKAIKLSNYRGLDGTVELGSALAVLAGPNNAGKSSVIDALRLVSQPFYDSRSRFRIQPSDFSHDGTGVPVATQLAISIELAGLSATDKGRMLTCLTPRDLDFNAVITLHAELIGERVVTRWTGGDAGNTDIEAFARTAIQHVYLPPLRDAGRDLRPGYSNRLGNLVSVFAPVGGADRSELERILEDANVELSSVEAIRLANEAIRTSLAGITGAAVFSHLSDMRFASPRYDRIVSNLRALMGQLAPLELDENGLGYNNLLYMAVLLSVLQRADETPLRLLLVEEPEAHLHPQLQDLLMKYLEGEAGTGTQVIVTTHSPQFAASAKVERLTVMAARPTTQSIASNLGALDMSERERKFLRRFLDVTKSSLLFSRGVILVEGIAEQLLVPEIAKYLGYDLSEHGVSVVNVGGLSFEAYVKLFGEKGLPISCSVITDGDGKKLHDSTLNAPPAEAPKASTETTIDGEENSDSGWTISAAASKIMQFANPRVRVFLSKKTFEWDLAAEQGGANRALLLEALRLVRPQKAKELSNSAATGEAFADLFLAAVEGYKGRFAQELAELLQTPVALFVAPDYLIEAVSWVIPAAGPKASSPSEGA